jgi:hypothetical protein
MAITILSLGFLSRSDVELACGENMILRTQMDYLAESGLEHARGLILNPQEVPLEELDPNHEYWVGRAGLQLDQNTNDFYNVNVTKLDEYGCNYQITSTAYREKGGERVGSSSLAGQLRLDPCIAVRTGGSWTVTSATVVSGDVCARGDLKGSGRIGGDAFSSGAITASNVEGQKYANVADINASVSFPGLVISDFSPQYYIGPNSYSADPVPVADLNEPNMLVPTASNPAGVYYRDANLTLYNNVVVNGTLVVNGNLEIRGRGNSITAKENFNLPAVVVDGKLQLYGNGQVTITGLAQIKTKVEHSGINGADFIVSGALFIQDGGLDGFLILSNHITVTAAPDKAAIEVWPSPGNPKPWSPVGGAFFKSIGRP